MGGMKLTKEDERYFRKVTWNCRGVLDFDDAWSEALIAIWEAQTDFDARGHMSLQQYSVKRIKWRLIRKNERPREDIMNETSICLTDGRGSEDCFADRGMAELSYEPDHDFALDRDAFSTYLQSTLTEREQTYLKGLLAGQTLTQLAAKENRGRKLGSSIFIGLIKKLETCKTRWEESSIKAKRRLAFCSTNGSAQASETLPASLPTVPPSTATVIGSSSRMRNDVTKMQLCAI